MAQFARPDGDTTVSGFTTAPLYSKVNEDTENDSPYISGTGVDSCELSLSAITDPGTTTGFYFRVRNQRGSGGATGTAYVMDGATQVCSLSLSLGAGWTTDTHNLTAGEVGNITNWDGLSVILSADTNAKDVNISWVELEAPSQSATLTVADCAVVPQVDAAGALTQVHNITLADAAVVPQVDTFAVTQVHNIQGMGDCAVIPQVDTPTLTVPSAYVIDIPMESDLDEWTSNSGGDLAWSNDATAQAIAGTSGAMSILINDTGALQALKILGAANTSGVVRGRFYFDPNGISMANNDTFTIMRLVNQSSNNVARMHFAYTDASGYQLAFTIYTDSAEDYIGTWEVIDDTPHWIEFEITRSTGANDGTAEWWIDDSSIASESSKDNDTVFANWISFYLGAGIGNAIDSGTSGTIYFDEVLINDTGDYIGPVSGAPANLTIADAAVVPQVDTFALTQVHNLQVNDAAVVPQVDTFNLTQDQHLQGVGDCAVVPQVDTFALTQDQHIQGVGDCAVIPQIDTFALTQVHNLNVADASVVPQADTFALTQVHNLVVADASVIPQVDAPTLNSSQNLVVANSSIVPQVDTFALTQVHNLSINDASVIPQVDAVTLTQVHNLSVADASVVPQVDTPTLNSAQNLQVADVSTTPQVDIFALSQVHNLSVADIASVPQVDAVTLTQVHNLQGVADCACISQVDAVVLSQAHNLTMADASCATQADAITLTQVHNLSIANCYVVTQVDTTTVNLEGVSELVVADCYVIPFVEMFQLDQPIPGSVTGSDALYTGVVGSDAILGGVTASDAISGNVTGSDS